METDQHDGELDKTKQRVLAVLLDGPVGGMHAWSDSGIQAHLPGRQQALLGEALWQLQAEGLLGSVETHYRGRKGLLWRLLDPASVDQRQRARARDEKGRYSPGWVSVGDDNELRETA